MTPNARSRKSFRDCMLTDPETDVAPGMPGGRNMRSRYRCSMCPAIHINSRSWLRSSSTHEPSDPPLRVIFCYRHAGSGKSSPDQSHRILLRQCSSEVGSERRKQTYRRGGGKLFEPSPEGQRTSVPMLLLPSRETRADQVPRRHSKRACF